MALELRLVVHHVRAADIARRSFLPVNPLARFALVSVVGAAGAIVTLIVAAFGGLDRADSQTSPEPPGTELENELFAVTPYEAWVETGDDGARLQVRADIELRASDVSVPVFEVGSGLVLLLGPSGTSADRPDVSFERMPESLVASLQPHMAEENAVLSWEMPEDVTASDLGEVDLAVHGMQELGTRDGLGSFWISSDDVAGTVTLPLNARGRS